MNQLRVWIFLGALTAGIGTDTVHFRADGPGGLRLTCTVEGMPDPLPVTVEAVAAPAPPEVTAPARAAPGQADLSAWVPPQPGATYQWTVDGGHLTAGSGTPSIRFRAGPRGSVLLSCRVVNPAGSASDPGRSVVEILPGRVLIQAPAWAVAGKPCTAAAFPAAGPCTWEIRGDAAISDGQGTGTLTFVPGQAGELTLTCRTPAGSDTVRVRVGEAPGILEFRAGTARLPEGGTTTVTPCFTGGRGILLPAAREVENGSRPGAGTASNWSWPAPPGTWSARPSPSKLTPIPGSSGSRLPSTGWPRARR